MKRISLIVPSHHTLFVEHICHLFNPNEVILDIYTTKKYLEELQSEGKVFYRQHNLIIDDERSSFPDFIQVKLGVINATQLVFVPTLRRYFKEFSEFDWKPPLMLGVHNMNYWFFRENRIAIRAETSLRQKFSAVKARLRNSDRERGAFLEKVRIVNFHNPSMKEYFFENYPGSKRYRVTTLPFSYYVPEKSVPKRTAASGAVFTVPGEVVEGRKNHLAIVEAFRKAVDGFRDKVKVVFLGKFNCSDVYRKTVIDACRNAEGRNLEFVLYLDPEYFGNGEMLRDSVFLQAIAETDCFVSAMKDNGVKDFDHYRETFGRTASSGLSFDCIRFRRPCIFKHSHEYLEDIQDGLELYRLDDEFPGAIQNMLQRDHLAMKKELMIKISQRYSREAIMDRFKSELAGSGVEL